MSQKSVATSSQPDFLVINHEEQERDGDERKFWREPDWELIETVTINREQDEARKETKLWNESEFECCGNVLHMTLSEMDSHVSSCTIEEASERPTSKKRRKPVECRLLSSDDRREQVTGTHTETAAEGGVSAIDLLMNLRQALPEKSSMIASNNTGRPSSSSGIVRSANHVNKRLQSLARLPVQDIEVPSTSGLQAGKRQRKFTVDGEQSIKQQPSAKRKDTQRGQKVVQLQPIETDDPTKQKPAQRRQKLSQQTKQSTETAVSSVEAELRRADRAERARRHWRENNLSEERKKKQQSETPEQTARRRQLAAASQQRYRNKLRLNEEELEKKRAVERERQRLFRQRQRELLQQTPKLAAERRAQEAERVRRRRAELRGQLPEDMIAERRRLDAERMRRRRDVLRGQLPVDVVAERRRLDAERMRRRREELRQNSEAMAERRAIERERTRRYRERKRMEHTPEQLELIRRAVAERRKLIQERGLLSGTMEDTAANGQQQDGEAVGGGDGPVAEQSNQLPALLALPAIEPQILPPTVDPAEIDRLALAAERSRLRNLQRRIQIRLTETPEQAAERRAKEVEQKRRARQSLTPEQLAARRESESVRLREYYRQLKQTNAEAVAKRKEKLRRYKQQKRQTETPEERAKRLALRQEYRRRLEERLTPEEAAERRRRKVEQARIRKMLKTGQAPKTPYTPKGTSLKEEVGDCWKSGCGGRTIITSRRHKQYFYGKLLYCKRCRSVKSLEKQRKSVGSTDSAESAESSSNRRSSSKRARVREQETGGKRRSVRLQSKGADKKKYQWWSDSSDVDEDDDDSYQMLPSDDDNQSTSNSQGFNNFQLSDISLASTQKDNWDAWLNTADTSNDQRANDGSDGPRPSSAVVEGSATGSSSVGTDGDGDDVEHGAQLLPSAAKNDPYCPGAFENVTFDL